MTSEKVFVVRGYGRASTDHQALSTDQQAAKILDAFHAFKTIKPAWKNAVWGGFMGDEAVSRQSIFRERHAGSMILGVSQPGDVILVSNFDRIFANVVDVCETLELLRTRQVGLIVLDMDIDTSTILGETVFTILAAMKRMEVREIARRTREHIEHRKRLGRPWNHPPIGWAHIQARVPNRSEPQRFLVPDPVARRLANKVREIRSNFRGFAPAAKYCNSIGLRQLSGRKWNKVTLNKWCRAARDNFVLPNGSHDPAPIPPDAVPVSIHTITPDD